MPKRPALCSLALVSFLSFALAAQAADYGHYLLGDPNAKTLGSVQPGLLLMGGGDRNFDALRWFMQRAGGGHIVVLRASQAGEIGEEFFNEVGGIASVETFVFKDRAAGSDGKILRALSERLGKTLPYDTLHQVRSRLIAVNKVFAAIDQQAPGAWGPAGKPGPTTDAPLKSSVANFYMTCPISRASRTMADCTASRAHLMAAE